MPEYERRPAGYADPALVTRRPWWTWAHLPALILAALADFAAFEQVLESVMRTNTAFVVLVAAGFAAAAVFLAHVTGTLLRDRVADLPHARRALITSTVVGWLTMGLAATAIRVLVGDGQRQQPVGLAATLEDAATDSSVGRIWANAAMFFGLYVAAGMVAAVGAYLTHNPLRSAYAQLQHGHRQAVRNAAKSAAKHERARHVLAQQISERERDRQRWSAAMSERLEWAEELKRYARHVMATRLQDPAATDGLTGSGRRRLHSVPDSEPRSA